MLQKIFLLLFACCLGACVHEPKTETEIIKEISVNKQLQAQKNACPVDVAPKAESSENDASVDPKFKERLVYHEAQCTQKASANSCYNFALGLQARGHEAAAEVMFQESCRMGVASGCTNRAAGIKSAGVNDEKMAQCISRTFAKTCEWKDPWGCTMYANQLVIGEGVKQDTQKALLVLKGSCDYGETDPACQTAHRFEAFIKEQTP